MTLDEDLMLHLLAPLSALMQDVRVKISEKHDFTDLEDKIRNLVLTRGPEVVLIDFPEMGADLDGWLSNCEIPQHYGGLLMDGPYGSIERGTHLFQFLLDELFVGLALTSEPRAEYVLVLRQILYFWKKVKHPCPAEKTATAVAGFLDCDLGIYKPDGSWNSSEFYLGDVSFSGDPDAGSEDLDVRWVLNWMDVVYPRLIPGKELIPEDIVPGHGPGAVADVTKREDKYTFPFWPCKLGNMFPFEQFALPSEEYAHLDGFEPESLREPPARISAVPKTYKGPRLITVEPSAHQYIQQGVLKWMRKHARPLLSSMYNPHSQVPNQEMALELSARPLSGGATVDLSEASDRLGLWVVERAFRSNLSLLRALHACRTETVVDGTGHFPDLSLRLRKYAGMGNATTFPVQSIVYAGIALSTILATIYGAPSRGAKKMIKRHAGKVRVFGDDIIFDHPEALSLLERVFSYLQLKINLKKTHSGFGPFRESCGMDAFDGQDVTPVYLRSRSPGNGVELASWVAVSNNAHKKGYWNLAAWMLDELEPSQAKLIPTAHEDQPCISLFTFCQGVLPPKQVRHNAELQREEVRVLIPRVRGKKVERDGHLKLLSYFIERPNPDVVWDSDHLDVRDVVVKLRWATLRV